jgi:TolB-like protein/Tfp pilus assembly protein PilF
MGRGRVFLEELKRRRVIRALVGWGLFAFAMLQVYEPVMHGLHLPEWTLSLVVLVLAAGFPATAALSWIFDLSSEGIERTAPPPPVPGATPRLSRGRIALLLGAVSLVGVMPGLGWYFVWRTPPAQAEAATRPATAGGTAEALRTVAVLPLVNLSGDPAQEYFSDGMTEEITSKLSRLSGLAVTARTSAAPYKGSRRSAREIGSELSVAYLVEGSVRKAGDRIRVTASLVRAADAIQLWSEDLDAKLDDIFAVQSRVATRIVEALGVKLSPGEAASLGSWGTRNAAAYDAYLKGQARYAAANDKRRDVDEAYEQFRRALEIDPGFAPAMAGLAACEALYHRDWDSSSGHLDRAEELVGRALVLDPQLVPAIKSAADIRGFRFDYPGATAQYRRIVELEPRNHVIWDQLCWSLGYEVPPKSEEAEAACRRALELAPTYPSAWYHLAKVLAQAGRCDEAERAIGQLRRLSDGQLNGSGRFWIGLCRGRPAESLAALRPADQSTNLDQAWRAIALAQLGRRDEAFAMLERALKGGFRDVADLRSGRWYQPLRGDPRWAATLARYGITP